MVTVAIARRTILLRPAEPPSRALEQQHLVRVDGVLRHRATHFVGHGAEILADDEATVPDALEREDRHQVIERIMHVAASVAPRPTGTHHWRNSAIT